MHAGTLPLEALKIIIPIAASHSPEFSLMHVDVSRAYFHAKAKRLVLVKLPVEDCSGKDEGKIGDMQQARRNETGKEIWIVGDTSWSAAQEALFHNKNQKTLGLTHGDSFCGGRIEERGLLELKNQLESVCPIKGTREYAGERGVLYQHEPRHVDVLVESLEFREWKTQCKQQ